MTASRGTRWHLSSIIVSLLVGALVSGMGVAGQEADGPLIHSVAFHPAALLRTFPFEPGAKTPSPGGDTKYRFKARKRQLAFIEPQLWGNRFEYWADDTTAQFFALLAATEAQDDQPLIPEGCHVVMSVMSQVEDKTFMRGRVPARDPRVSFLVNVKALPFGAYRARAELVAADKTLLGQADFDFTKTDKRNPVVEFPKEGIAILLEDQAIMSDGTWPVKLGVPLPRGTVEDVNRLALYEDGVRIPAEVRSAATWEPKGASKWVHLDFVGRYQDGKPARYRLKHEPAPLASMKTGLVCTKSKSHFQVDTGYVRFKVNHQAFNGIEQAWFDASGKGAYDLDAPVIEASGDAGPYLADETETRFTASADSDVEVTVEELGPVKVRITARGWYVNPRDPDQRLCKYTTSISAYANSPLVRVEQYTYITYNTDKKQLSELGFLVSIPNASTYRLGADGKALSGDLPRKGSVFLHQDRWDHWRFVTGDTQTEGGRSDGWFSVRQKRGPRVTLLLRDVWQKFPKECELSRDGIDLQFWPKHGGDTFSEEEELSFKQLYKFLCFHEGSLLNLKTPSTYVERFDTYAKDPKSNSEGSNKWWRDAEHDGTRDGNAQGVVIGNEFALVFSADPDQTPTLTDSEASLAELFVFDPTARPAPAWSCSTRVLGPIAEVDRERFPVMEDCIEKGFFSWAGSVERGNDYGMFNYADTHTKWNAAENRAYFHRVWLASHYHSVGMAWINTFRSGSPDWLRWARKKTDHYVNIDITNYVDEEDPVRVRDHDLGAMQHMGWKTHWGSSGEAWGTYKGLMGHWIDPDAPLWSWYMTGNRRAKEAYGFWFESFKKIGRGPWKGFARNYNNTFAYMISSYEATHDPTLLPAIYTLGYHLPTKNLHKQQPAPLCHPLWLNRYHDMTRDPAYVDLIIRYAREGLGTYAWPIALSCKAISLGGEPELLTRFFDRARMFPLKYFRKEGHPYDWYGAGPGALGDGFVYMTWGHFVQKARELGIDGIPDGVKEGGGYPFSSSGWNHRRSPPSTSVYVHEEKDGPLVINLGLRPMGGSLHAVSVHLIDPTGKETHYIERVGRGGDKNDPITVAADGMTGLYRIDFRSHEAFVPMPQSNHDLEAVVMAPERTYIVSRMGAWFMPVDGSESVTLKVHAEGISNVLVKDANLRVIDQLSLFSDVGEGDADLRLDADRHPAPWFIEVVGKARIGFENVSERGVVVSDKRGNAEKLAAMLRANDS